jgi:hypothetical protein
MNHQNKTNKILITRLEQAFNHLPLQYGYTRKVQHVSIVRETGYPRFMVYNSYLQFLNGRQRNDLNARDSLIICQFLDWASIVVEQQMEGETGLVDQKKGTETDLEDAAAEAVAVAAEAL